jgi:phosphatidylglycerophosphate synthase
MGNGIHKDDDAWLSASEIEGTRSFSDKVASRLDWTTANQISLSRIVLSIPVALFYAYDFVLVGSLILTVGYILDFFDGAVARYQSRKYDTKPMSQQDEKRFTFLEVICYKGQTYTGTVLDRLADKILYFCAVIPLAYAYLDHFLLFGSLAMAILLSVVSPIQDFFHIPVTASNWFGKRKIWVEIGVIASVVFFPRGETMAVVSNIILGMAFVFAILSFTGHMYLSYKKYRNAHKSTT